MKKSIVLAFLFIALVGCSSSNNNHAKLTATPAVEILTQSSPTTLPLPTASITPTQIIPKINSECVEITSPPKNRSEGILVLQQGIGSRLVFLKNKTGDQRYVPADGTLKVWGAYISPDGKQLIYDLDWGEPNGATKFILTKADGIQQKEIPYYGDWGWNSIYWLNDKSLKVSEVENIPSYLNNFAFDPLTGMKLPLRSDFPRMANNKNVDWYLDRGAMSLGMLLGSNIIYDPTLTRVLYPKNGETVSLFNIETDKEIVRQFIPGWGRSPKWSLDGKNLAIIGSISSTPKIEALDEFLMISRDGLEFKRITYLTSVFDSVHIDEYSWSPDGTHIAFWLGSDNNQFTEKQNPFELAVMDIQTAEITKYCIMGISSLEVEGVIYDLPIIWLPDSTQLVITRHKDDNNQQTEVIMIDTASRTAYKIVENMQPIGWMIP